MTVPLVSVVVIGRNEGPRLSRCLASVTAMECSRFRTETIYVDSGSTDDSVARAQASGVQVIALACDRPTAALGRNAGWLCAAGEFIMFLDGDTEIDQHFVARTLCEFEDPGIAVVWGHRRETFATPSLYNRVLDLDWIYAPGETAFCGGDALMRRTVLESVGGYDETLIAGEEPELCRRIRARGLRILHVDRPMTKHDLGITGFRQYWKRAVRSGHAFAEVSERFAGSSDPFWRAESRGNSRKAIMLASTPAAGMAATLLWRSLWPLGLSVAVLTLLVLRTAWKARWKSKEWVRLVLYGIHSHFQQVPIFCGQWMYWVNRERGHSAEVVDYKQQ